MAYRAFYALKEANFVTKSGQHTNAVYGFTSMLINLLRDEKPTHVAVCFDVSRKTFRSEQYAEYKANRSATPDEFKGQISLIEDVLATLAVPSFAKEGFEADDLIATHHHGGRRRGLRGLDLYAATATRSSWSTTR